MGYSYDPGAWFVRAEAIQADYTPSLSGKTTSGYVSGGIRKGAAGYDITFLHPKSNEQFPIAGEGVLIELVQAPPEVIAALG